jgi:hypothetical protein
VRVLVAAGAALALADGSIVVLALPELLVALDTSVEGVAAIIGVYTAVLAIALIPSDGVRRRVGPARLGTAGLLAFGLASLGCGLSGSLALMLTMRAVQALGGAATLVAAFALLDAGSGRGGGGRLWMIAAIGGAAAGPALGGALTQAFSWSAIFLAQVPVALAGAVACATTAHADTGQAYRSTEAEAAASALDEAPRGLRWRAGAALALLSAALTAVLFLLVLVLVAGWGYEPLAGAAVLTVLPLAALGGMRVGGAPRARAAAGCLLVAGGVAALAPIPTASAWWVIVPELAAGAGMGMALPALSEALLPERTPSDAARVLTARHVGIAAALAVLLDARIDPLSKIDLVGQFAGNVGEDDPREDLDRSLTQLAAELSPEEQAELATVRDQADQTIVTAVSDTFRPAFGVTALFAVGAAALLVPGRPDRRLPAAGATAVALPLLALAIAPAVRPEPVTLADPCAARELPDTGGITGFAQDTALRGLDLAACRFGSSREELVLALANPDDAEAYEDEHGVNPRSPSSLLGELLEDVPGYGELESTLENLTP